MATSITASLGIGSGIDTAKLIDDLTAATRAPKDQQITARETLNKAKISALATTRSGIDAFASSLSALISGGTLFTQPTSSDTVAVGVSALPGSRLGDLSSRIEVSKLAQAQTVSSGLIDDRNAPIGRGDLVISVAGGGSQTITIDESNDSLTGLARAINAAGGGFVASVVSDAGKARLVLKGRSGEAAAFTISADPALAQFAYPASGGAGMTLAQPAQDAELKIDGVSLKRATNSFSDAIPGVAIELKKVTTDPVSIGSSRPTSGIRQAVIDFVGAYNELEAVLDEATASGLGGTEAGALRADRGVADLRRELARLTSTKLSSQGSVTTLAEIGVRTNRDGTLAVDTNRLDAVLAADPDAVESLFNPSQRSSSPLVNITSAMGKAKPGTYQLTDISAGPPPAGKLNGVDMISSGSKLIAPAGSPGIGLVLEPLGAVASATITVDAGLGGALQSLRDTLQSSSGALTASDARIKAEEKAIAADRDSLEKRMTTYRERMVKQFTAMDSKVAAFKATQSYLEQQVKIWSNDD